MKIFRMLKTSFSNLIKIAIADDLKRLETKLDDEALKTDLALDAISNLQINTTLLLKSMAAVVNILTDGAVDELLDDPTTTGMSQITKVSSSSPTTTVIIKSKFDKEKMN